jgi:heme exporter protein C
VRYSKASNTGQAPLGHVPLQRALGLSALVALALTTWWGLWVSPPDAVQGQFVRILYVHPAVATMSYMGFGLCALASLAWLWPRTRSRRWDRLAVTGAEVGSVFCLATLVTGSIWGRATWGVWWTWDPRLTLTAILFAMSLGYLALRRSIDNSHARSVGSSVVAVLMALTVVVDHYATSWWNSLHQGITLTKPDPTVHGWQLTTMLVSFLAFGLLTAWVVLHRYQLEMLEERYEQEGIQLALAARRSEAAHPEPAGLGTLLPDPRSSGSAKVENGDELSARRTGSEVGAG